MATAATEVIGTQFQLLIMVSIVLPTLAPPTPTHPYLCQCPCLLGQATVVSRLPFVDWCRCCFWRATILRYRLKCKLLLTLCVSCALGNSHLSFLILLFPRQHQQEQYHQRQCHTVFTLFFHPIRVSHFATHFHSYSLFFWVRSLLFLNLFVLRI